MNPVNVVHSHSISFMSFATQYPTAQKHQFCYDGHKITFSNLSIPSPSPHYTPDIVSESLIDAVSVFYAHFKCFMPSIKLGPTV